MREGRSPGDWADFARRLERERDEARFQLSAYSINPERVGQTEIAMARTANSQLVESLAELGQLRKVADELAKQLAYLNDVERWSYSTKENNHKALAAYNALRKGKE